MLIWIIKDGEYMPVQKNTRMMRSWMLSNELIEKGHSIVWWASTFSHQEKKLIYDYDVEIKVRPQFKLKLLYAGKYSKNISVKRYLHHYLLGKSFEKHSVLQPPPDIIVCSFPLIDLAYKAVFYANRNNIPIIVDVRDLWPDTFINKIPCFARKIAKLVFSRDFVKTKELLRNADGLAAISQGCLNWALRNANRPESINDRVFYPAYSEDNLPANRGSEFFQRFKVSVQDKIIFTFIGSFGYSYELRLICDVAQKLMYSKKNNIHFVLAGNGQQYKTIARRIQRLSNVSLLGWLNKYEIYDLLRLSNIGLVPCRSVVDAMPNKLAEYFSAGLPILSSLEGEMQKIISDYNVGYSYKPGDEEAFCRLVMKLFADPKLRKLQSENALKLFKSKFNSKDIFNDYVSYIEQIYTNKRHVFEVSHQS